MFKPYTTTKTVIIFTLIFFVAILSFVIYRLGVPLQTYKDNLHQLQSKLTYAKATPSTQRCTASEMGSRRLIVSLEDDFNPSWLLLRLIRKNPFWTPNLSFSNFDDLQALHDSFPCGIGGVHLTPSILYTTNNLEELRSNIIKSFSTKLKAEEKEFILEPIIAIDFPDIILSHRPGWNHLVALQKFGICCYDLYKEAGVNVIWGPSIDDIKSNIELKSVQEEITNLKLPRKTIFFNKHFGLHAVKDFKISKNHDSHLGPVKTKRSLSSLSTEWERLKSIPTNKDDLKGIMVSHVIIENLDTKPLTYSNLTKEFQKNSPNVVTVSDSLDMLEKGFYFSENHSPWNNVSTDFILWVNFYSGADVVNKSPRINDLYEKLIDTYTQLNLIK